MSHSELVPYLVSIIGVLLSAFFALYAKSCDSKLERFQLDLCDKLKVAYVRIEDLEKRNQHVYLKPETAEQIDLRLAPALTVISELKETVKELKVIVQDLKS